jgi:dipeptidyl-peptidase-3
VQLEEDHMKNRQMIVNYILDRSRAVTRYERDDKTFFRVEDFEEMRRTAGDLLAEVMRIKAEGDLPAAKALIDRYGLPVDSTLRDQVHRRAAPLDEPLYTGFVYPELRLLHDGDKENLDVLVEYPESLAEQMKGWQGKII